MTIQENNEETRGTIGNPGTPIEGDPESTGGKVSYGGTTGDTDTKNKQDQGFPPGSYGESSEGGEENIIDKDSPLKKESSE